MAVEIDGKSYKIRNDCDYRVILDVIIALNDEELDMADRVVCALHIFYENMEEISDVEKAIVEMTKIINLGENSDDGETKPKVMDWEHDFNQIAPPISRVLGYDVRTPCKHTHWYTFVGGYMEIGGECTFATIVSIRQKKSRGKKLDDWEQEFYRENKKMIDLPHKLTEEELEFLNSDW